MTENRLIAELPRPDRQRLLAACTPVALVLADVLSTQGTALPQVYFPIDSVLALMAEVDGHAAMAVGLVGNEGLLGAYLMLGHMAPLKAGASQPVLLAPLSAVVQCPGQAWRLGSAEFRRLLEGSVALQRSVGQHLARLVANLGMAVACTHFHQIGPRLARWLLMSDDRVPNGNLELTHTQLAGLLGVRRVGVTVAAGVLQRAGLIGYHRGHLRVLDRPGLESASCPCYAAQRAAP